MLVHLLAGMRVVECLKHPFAVLAVMETGGLLVVSSIGALSVYFMLSEKRRISTPWGGAEAWYLSKVSTGWTRLEQV